jgi:hypothetical protein
MVGIIKNQSLIIFICVFVVMLAVLYFAFLFNKTSIICDSRSKLAELTKMDFTDVVITDIQCKNFKEDDIGEYTRIFIFLKEFDELESKEYYFNIRGAGIPDPNLDRIPSGHIRELKKIGIEIDNIQKHGGNFNEIKVGFQIVPYEIHWYQIDNSYDGESNVILLTFVPRRVLMNVDKIIRVK